MIEIYNDCDESNPEFGPKNEAIEMFKTESNEN